MTTSNKTARDRSILLADVAELYYLKGKNQTEIANQIGVDRSMVSRMLTEARKKNIVEISVRRALISDEILENSLNRKLNLLNSLVFVNDGTDYPEAQAIYKFTKRLINMDSYRIIFYACCHEQSILLVR